MQRSSTNNIFCAEICIHTLSRQFIKARTAWRLGTLQPQEAKAINFKKIWIMDHTNIQVFIQRLFQASSKSISNSSSKIHAKAIGKVLKC
ncbi:hypothetical protein VNO78_03331 [Psophocarpus tetragonolobus]|uniref:Uncharacterized protein n=1 Tax=Psophocarpus tetragonolobus TaxID=3891 RepID=A0AAN9XW08_PSOTE